MKNKKGFEFGFAWIFAILAGAAILFLAVFATINLISTSRYEVDTKVAAQLGILLNPVETNLESGKYTVIEFPSETRVFNRCRETGNFGQQRISTSVKSGIGKEFQEQGVESVFYNKYIFSSGVEQGKKLHVFVKPLKMPYKIADLIFISSGNYCFINPPDIIEDEVLGLGLKNVKISSGVRECPKDSKVVCFSSRGCDVNVDLQSRSVEKSGQTVYYEENSDGESSLIYGAIFADPEIYECQVKRLMKRTGELAHLYALKSEFLTGKGCTSGLAQELRNYANIVQIESSFNIRYVAGLSEELRRRNNALSCELF
ncbi:MAG: hypothetical protein IIA87_02140 [Nanoarchaeota archaeon]|nr:hypothetical protein [Nanoarchaeota archaeon]